MLTLKNYCILLLLSCFVQGYTQGTSALERVDSLAQLGEYKNAIRVTEAFLDTKPRNFALSLAYFELSKAYMKLGDLAVAMDYNKESQSIKERIGYEYFADNLMQAGLIEHAGGNAIAALAYYEEAAGLPHETVLFSAQLERNIGLAKLDMEELEEAEKSFENTLELLRWEVGELHIEVVDTYVALGRVQTKKGQFLEALKTFSAAKSMLESLKMLPSAASLPFYNAVTEWFWMQEPLINRRDVASFNLSSLRDRKREDEAVIIYRYEDLYFAALAFSKEELVVVLEDHSRRMRGMSNEKKSYDLMSMSEDDYMKSAYELYNFFITPVSSVLDKTKRLTVVTYDELEDLDFAALLGNPLSASSDFTEAEFLGKNHLIQHENTMDFNLMRSLSGPMPGGNNIRFSEDFPGKYKRKVKKQFKKYLKGNSRAEAVWLTQKWMMGKKGMAEPRVWLGVS